MELRALSGHADLASLRAKANSLGLGAVEAQNVGAASDVMLRVQVQPGGEPAQAAAVKKLREAFDRDYEIRSVEEVGPSVSGELVQSGILGVVVAILCVLTYLWFRFEWQFAVGAIIGTMHDLLLTVGFFAFTQLEFNQTSIAAILTIVGYSLNETVVVLDRIREVMRKYKKLPTADIIDMSVNAVLPRTIMTATTVFLALLALFFLGGEVIRSFSAAMIWGIFVATYSSIFICSPMLIYLGVRHDVFDKAAAPGETSAADAKAKA
jgi:preprotein translocase subunit SecF